MGRLHFAARRGLLAEVEAAIADGEPLDEAVGSGLTPLHIAAQEGFTKIVRALLDAGADPLVAHPNGRTALHFAAGGGHLNAVAALVEHGVLADLPTRGGTTPALEAAELNYRDVAAFLLERGADPKAKNRKDRTVEEWLEVGGVMGIAGKLHAEHIARDRANPARWIEPLRRMMAKYPTVEEYAAHHGRRMFMYSLDQDEIPDSDVDRWAKRFGEILRSPELLADCEDRFLQGDALAEAQRRRARNARAAARREAREAELRRRREELA